MASLRISRSLSSRVAVALFALVLAVMFYPGLVAGGMPKWMVLYAAAGCAVLCSRRLALDRVMLAGLAILGWAALSLAWSSDPASGALQIHKFGVLAVLFCAARAWGRDWNLPLMAVISAVAILAMVPIVPIAGFGNENFITDYLLMLSPFLVAFGWKNRKSTLWYFLRLRLLGGKIFSYNPAQRGAWWGWLPLIAVAIYLIVFNGARSEFLVAGVAVVAGLVIFRCYWTALIIGFSGLNFLLLWPQVFGKSLLARLELASATIAMWWDQPFWGQGFGAFSYNYPTYGQAWRVFMPDYPTFVGANLFAGASHNEPLQIMAELGLIGLALVGVFLFLSLRHVLNKDKDISLQDKAISFPKIPALWCVGIAGILSLIEFPLQLPASAALGAVALGVVVGPIKQPIRLPQRFSGRLVAAEPGAIDLGHLGGHISGSFPEKMKYFNWLRGHSIGHFSVKSILIAFVIATAYLGSLEWRGHVAYGQAAMVLRTDSLAAFRANLYAYEHYPWDWQIRHQLYRTFAIMAQRNTVKVGAKAMERIYTISSSAAPFAPYVLREGKP